MKIPSKNLIYQKLCQLFQNPNFILNCQLTMCCTTLRCVKLPKKRFIYLFIVILWFYFYKFFSKMWKNDGIHKLQNVFACLVNIPIRTIWIFFKYKQCLIEKEQHSKRIEYQYNKKKRHIEQKRIFYLLVWNGFCFEKQMMNLQMWLTTHW